MVTPPRVDVGFAMFSGGSGAGRGGAGEGIGYPTRWALNPSAYKNVSAEQVDWAALAQQWIQMKEARPPPSAPAPTAAPAPTPTQTSIAVVHDLPHANDEEGEAPMDVDANDMDAPAAPIISPQQWKTAGNSSARAASWEQWGSDRDINNDWNWQTEETNSKIPHIPSVQSYNPAYTADTSFSGYNNTNQQNYRSGYWTTEEAKNIGNNSSIHLNESVGSRPNRRPVRHPPDSPTPNISLSNVDTTQTIDAAKRRQLPAWIREGLEKMEREKQKQMDREREKKEREEYMKQKNLTEEANIVGEQDNITPQIPAKSKFDTDSDDSEQGNTAQKKNKIPSKNVSNTTPLLQKTSEEVMQDMMLSVRRVLTEILLDVTNEQIVSLCQEEIVRKKSLAQASRGTSVASKTQALSTIGGQLGLGIYGDSSDSESEDSEDNVKKRSPSYNKQESLKHRKGESEKFLRGTEDQLTGEGSISMKKQERDMMTGSGERKSLHRMGEKLSNSESDGEESSSNNRSEVNVSKQRKNHSESTSFLDNAKKAFPGKVERQHQSSKNDQGIKDRLKKEKPYHLKKSKKRSSHKTDSKKKLSGTSDSESDSGPKRSEDSGNKSNSYSDSNSSDTESSSNSTSESSNSSKKKIITKSKRRISSDDSENSKKYKRYKNKTPKEKSKHKNSEYGSNNVQQSTHSGKKNEYEQKMDFTTKNTPPETYRSHTPEKSNYKSKYNDRSRSRSNDRHKQYDSHSKYNSTYRYRSTEKQTRSKDKSEDNYYKEKRERSREDKMRSRYKSSYDGKERSRDERDWSRDDRDKSRDVRERSRERYDKERDKRGDRKDYKETRSSRY